MIAGKIGYKLYVIIYTEYTIFFTERCEIFLHLLRLRIYNNKCIKLRFFETGFRINFYNNKKYFCVLWLFERIIELSYKVER